MRQQLERKEDMKSRGLSSPDCADVVAMCFAYATLPPTRADFEEWTVADLEPPAENWY